MSRFDDDEDDIGSALAWDMREPRAGNDTPPLFSYVQDQPYSTGKLTSQPRTASPQYLKFLERNKEQRNNGRE